MRRMFAFLVAGTLATIGLLLFSQTSASAHTPTGSITCTSWQLSAVSYSSKQGDATPNLLSYKVDGGNQVNVPFNTGTQASGSFAANSGNHTVVAQFTAWDDPDGSKGWTKSLTLTSTNCAAPPATSTVTVTPPPVVTTVTVSAPPSTVTVTPSTSTTTVTAPPVTSTVTVPGGTTTAPGTTVTAPGKTSVVTSNSTKTSTATSTVAATEKQTIVKSGSSTKTYTSVQSASGPSSALPPSQKLAQTGSQTGSELAVAAGLIGLGGLVLWLARKRRVREH